MDSFRQFLASWKDAAQTLSLPAGMIAAFWALHLYRSNARRERARWFTQLFDKFFEADRYRKVRERLDVRRDSAEQWQLEAIDEMVEKEAPEFTDYLNFFEMVAVLVQTKQLRRKDAVNLFDYYLQCLKRHPKVLEYIQTKKNGFEHLTRFLETIPVSSD